MKQLLQNIKTGKSSIEDVPMPNTRHGIPVYFVISRVEAASNLHRYDGVKYGFRAPEPLEDLRQMYKKSRAQAFGPQPKLRILMGMYVSAAFALIPFPVVIVWMMKNKPAALFTDR